MAYSVRKIDRDTLPRDEDSDDDSEWLDDPVALGLQSAQSDTGITSLQNIERPQHISPETHDLVLKTMRGSDAWHQTKKADEEMVKLRLQRLAELRKRASAGGADGRAAALVAAELEDLDGERLTRALTTQGQDDCLVVHIHAPSAYGSAVLDAAVATLAARHSAIRNNISEGGDHVALHRNDTRLLSSKGLLAFARLSAVDAGVTARLDVVDESVLPAILVYRGGLLSNSRMSVMLPSIRDREDHGVEREKSAENKVFEDVDLEQLADEVEDLLDELGLYD